jgi:hypothetical protein
MTTTVRLQQHYLDELPLLLGGGVEVVVLVLGVRVVRIVREHLHLYYRAPNISLNGITYSKKPVLNAKYTCQVIGNPQ